MEDLRGIMGLCEGQVNAADLCEGRVGTVVVM